MPNFSVLIPTFNEQESIPICLASLLPQLRPQDELMIVDCSTDSTVQMVQETYQRFHTPCQLTILQDEKRGVPAARNLGITKAKGEVIVCVDADMVASQSFMAVIDANFRFTPELMALGGVVLPSPYDAQLQDWAVFLMWLPSQPFLGATGNNMCLHKAVFEEVGLFEDGFRDDYAFWNKIVNSDLPYRIDPRLISYISLRRIYADGPYPLGYIKAALGAWKQDYKVVR